jgi:hypothetical protein
MTVIAVCIHSVLLVTIEASVHIEPLPLGRRSGGLLHRPVALGALELRTIDVPPMRKEDIRPQLRLLAPQQFLSGGGDLAQLCFFRACAKRGRMAGHAEIDGRKRGVGLRLYPGMTVGAGKAILDVLGVIKCDGLALRGARTLMSDDRRPG